MKICSILQPKYENLGATCDLYSLCKLLQLKFENLGPLSAIGSFTPKMVKTA